MKAKQLILTSILFLGFTFNNCVDEQEDDCNFPNANPYFDIEGVKINNLNLSGNILSENDTVELSDYYGMSLNYEVSYHASHFQRKKNWSFGTMNMAYGCTPPVDGYDGSKTERLKSIYIITLNDLYDTHLANDTINDLLSIERGSSRISLDDFLIQDTSLIEN
ncbi:MAG: hypothetical protein AB8F74_05075, partial [Saprospiraceae bacterium]